MFALHDPFPDRLHVRVEFSLGHDGGREPAKLEFDLLGAALQGVKRSQFPDLEVGNPRELVVADREVAFLVAE